MGTGDWNDGMNRVGAGGKGESVWNAWFLITILDRFRELAEARGDRERAARQGQEAERLRQAIAEQAWDGHWYRRAYFDDGTPLGSSQNEECKIDSLVQSWAVIAEKGVGSLFPPAVSPASDQAGEKTPDAFFSRAAEAMAAVEEFLVRPEDRLILLFTPPFDQGKLQPGYIKGYVPGIRENGGQYTHAAAWVVQATALLGQGTRAMQLFDLLNPILHATRADGVARYKVEPYVVAGDVYGRPPHVGRGGWTWYTGSAGWLYRVALETILGLQRDGNRLRFVPCIPSAWDKYEINYRHGSSTYHITVENPEHVEHGVKEISLDGKIQSEAGIDLQDDGRRHEVRVLLGG